MCEVTAIDLTEASGVNNLGLTVFIAYLYNNPLPVGSEVSITSENGILTGSNSYIFPNTTSKVPMSVSFGITREPIDARNDKTSGSLTINLKATSGLVTSVSINVIDDKKL